MRLGYLISIVSGVSYDKKDVCSSGIRILRGGNINNLLVTPYQDDVFLPAYYRDAEKQVRVNDIVIVASTGSKSVIGKAGYIVNVLDDTQIGAFLRIIRPLFQELVPYIKLIFATDYYREHIRTQSQGTNINNVKADYITQLLVPLPPLKEQERIVKEIEKFEPLIAEYDTLEQEKSKLDSEIYDKFKKSILQYAIQGKLVPQDTNDEPASVLLEKIRAEKKAKLGKKYVDSYIYKGDDNCYYEHIDGKYKDEAIETPFDLPNTWVWCRADQYLDVRDGTHDTPRYVQDGYPLVTSKNLNNGCIDFSSAKLISKTDLDIINGRSYVENGDILFAMIGSIGNPVKVKKDREFAIKNMALFKPAVAYIDMEYVLYFLIYAQELMKKQSSGGVQQFVSLNYLRRFLIPIPPLAEQKRIVNKVNKTFAKL